MKQANNSGLTLMIVDDEPLMRQGFRLMLDWQSLGIDQLIEAANAEEAAKEALAYQPDIVVTDIRMPGVNGLELIERLKTLLPETPVIIISGYSDFNYAKQAIQLGVTDYLVKPINQNELKKAIDHCLRHIQEQHKHRQGALTISCTTLTDCFNQLLTTSSEPVSAAISEQIAQMDILCDGLLFQIAFIHWPSHQCPDLSRQRSVVSQDPLSQRIEVVLYDQTAIRCLIGARSSDGLQTETVLQAQLGLFDYADQKDAVRVISPIIQSVRQIGIQARQARKTAQFKQFLGQQGTFSLSSDGLHTEKQIYLNREDRRRLIHFITVGDQPAIHQLLQELQAAYQQSVALDPDVFYAGILEILVSLQRMIQEAGIRDCDSDCLTQDYLKRFHTLSDLFDWLEKHILRLSECLNQHRSLRKSPAVIMQMQTAVQNQLDRNWRLEDFGALYHYHPSYLSRLFKREEGISFSEYLIQVRIAEAQKRLITTSESIKGICLDVGYKDYHTFLSTFKDIVGMTPQAYRKEQQT